MDIKEKFLLYLKEEVGVARSTLKFYKSDLSHFTAWLLLRVRAWGILTDKLDEAVAFLSPKVAEEYKYFLIKNQTSSTTVNRKLSTLRSFAHFLTTSGVLASDFMAGITNISSTKKGNLELADRPENSVVEKFKKYLEAEKISPNTIKNYLSDINQFITWNQKHAQPA